MQRAGVLLVSVWFACVSAGNLSANDMAGKESGWPPSQIDIDALMDAEALTPLDRLRLCSRVPEDCRFDVADQEGPPPRADRPGTVDDGADRAEEVGSLSPSPAGPMFAAPPPIVSAIVKASVVTGADFEFLFKTAALESSFNQDTEAKTSSAVGLFQFVENTWLIMIRELGSEYGIERFAAAIVMSDGGECEVPDAEMEEQILQLRYDPELSALMAGAFVRRNAAFVARQLGRNPEPGELYIAHFLGANGGSQLIRLAEKEPHAHAHKRFPRAARANRPIFYDGRKPRTIAQVYDRLMNKYRNIPIHVGGAVQRIVAVAVVPKPTPRTRLAGAR